MQRAVGLACACAWACLVVTTQATDDTEPKVVNTMLITVNDESEPDDTPDKRPDTQVEVQIFDDEDAASSVFRTLTETKFHGQYESTHVMLKIAHLVHKRIESLAENKMYTPPKELRLRSAGAHKKRALVHMKAEAYPESGADLLRALMRKGLEEPVIKRLNSHMEDIFRLGRKQKELQAIEQQKAEAAEARRVDEEKAAAESRLRAAEDEKDWTGWLTKSRVALGFITLCEDEDADTCAGSKPCCPGGDGKMESGKCGETDCSKPGEVPCEGAYMATSCAKTCGLCSEADDAAAKALAASSAAGSIVTGLNLKLNKKVGEVETQHSVTLPLHEGHDAARAVYEFCLAEGMHSHEEVTKLTGMLNAHMQEHSPGYVAPAHLSASSAEEHAERATVLLRKGDLVAAGAELARAFTNFGDEQSASKMVAVMGIAKKVRAFEKLFFTGKWKQAISEVAQLHREQMLSQRIIRFNSTILLMQGRCHQQLGHWSAALRAASAVIDETKSHGSWVRGSERMMAVSLGARATMELGNSDKALKLYKIVLKYDPDQKTVRRQYKALKSFDKVMKKAEDKLTKGRNHDALELLEQSLSILRGMEVDSGAMRSSVLLKLCRAQSGMNMHEEAFVNCDLAVDSRNVKVPGLFVNPGKVAEAYLARGEANMNDKNFADAVADFREAAQHSGSNNEEDVEQKLREAQQAQEEWDDQDRRDHAAVLGLPVNLDELAQDKQCTWLKKQYKKMARRWHPDKYKGNKKRAERKMREMSEAKEVLGSTLGCDGGKRDRERGARERREQAQQQQFHHGGGGRRFHHM